MIAVPGRNTVKELNSIVSCCLACYIHACIRTRDSFIYTEI